MTDEFIILSDLREYLTSNGIHSTISTDKQLLKDKLTFRTPNHVGYVYLLGGRVFSIKVHSITVGIDGLMESQVSNPNYREEILGWIKGNCR